MYHQQLILARQRRGGENLCLEPRNEGKNSTSHFVLATSFLPLIALRNRQAQKTFREKREAYLRDLEGTAASAKENYRHIFALMHK